MTLESLEVRDQLRWDWQGMNGITGADEVDGRITAEKCEGTYGEWTIGNGEEGEQGGNTVLVQFMVQCVDDGCVSVGRD